MNKRSRQLPSDEDDRPEADRLRGWQAICEGLAECGWPEVSRFAALRLAGRRVKPLPVDGYRGAPWSDRAALRAWVEAERRRNGRVRLEPP